MLRFCFLIVLGTLLTMNLHAQEDTTAVHNPPFRAMVMGSLSRSFKLTSEDYYERAFVSLDWHLEFDYFHTVPDKGEFMTGLRFGGYFSEHFPENVPTRVREYWIDLPVRLYTAKRKSHGIQMITGAGLYYSFLIQQDIFPQPGLELPAGYQSSQKAFAYGKWGLTFDGAVLLPGKGGSQVTIGVIFYLDVGTVHKSEDVRITTNMISLSLYAGVKF